VLRLLGRPGGVVPALWRRLRAAARSRASWILLGGALAGALVTALVTGALPVQRDDPGEHPSGHVVLHVYGGNDSNRARRSALDAWVNLQTRRGLDLAVEYHPMGETADAQRRIAIDVLDPKGRTDVDLVILDGPDLPRFADAGQLVPLDDEATGGFLKAPLAASEYGRHRWGLPLNTDAPLLVYDAGKLTGALGLKKDQLRAKYRALRRNANDVIAADGRATLAALGDPAGKHIYSGQFADYEGFTVNLDEQLASAGLDLAGDPFLTGGAAARAVATVAARLRDPVFVDPAEFGRPGVDGSGTHENETVQALADGQVLFARLWPAWYVQLQSQLRERPDPPDLDAVPLRPGTLGGQMVAVATKSEHPGLAKDLLRFLTSDAIQYQLFLDGGYASTRELPYAHPSIRDQYRYTQDLRDGLEQAISRPRVPHYDRYSAQLRRELRVAFAAGGQLRDGWSKRLEDASRGAEVPD
jgi:ABC-type glycerol-3-phosphate transport system substrate-binding protein